jgi:hypothetical protein
MEHNVSFARHWSVSGIATECQAILCILFIHSLQSHQDVTKKVICNKWLITEIEF